MTKIEQSEGIATDEELREREQEALERELAGRLNRKAELEAMNAHPDRIAEVDEEIKAARKALKPATKGQASATKRPRKAADSR